MKKVSIFVDVQNIYYTTKQQFNCNFDYNKFWKTSNVTIERLLLQLLTQRIEVIQNKYNFKIFSEL